MRIFKKLKMFHVKYFYSKKKQFERLLAVGVQTAFLLYYAKQICQQMRGRIASPSAVKNSRKQMLYDIWLYNKITR